MESIVHLKRLVHEKNDSMALVISRVFLKRVAALCVTFAVFAQHSLVAWEGVMWVDKLAGWDKIPGTSHASHFLQRFITTRVPGKQELLTAQRALRELVVAHNP